MEIKIFIGCTHDYIPKGKLVQELLHELEIEETKLITMPWWDENLFPLSISIYDSLNKNIDEIDAAILLGTKTNPILEFGLVEGRKGKGRALLGIENLEDLPSDLGGILELILDHSADDEAFKKNNAGKIRSWIAQVKAKMLEPINGADNKMNDLETAVDALRKDLPNCNSILAIDVNGPSAWKSPESYEYLASQISFYLRRNFWDDAWKPVVSPQLYTQIKAACALYETKYQRPLSLSGFDSGATFAFEQGQPRLEFARVLLWSREELLDPQSDSIINFHKVFNIPLFFRNTEKDDELRKTDYVILQKTDNSVCGYYSSALSDFQIKSFEDVIPGKTLKPTAAFYSLFDPAKTLLAIDARSVLKENPFAEM